MKMKQLVAKITIKNGRFISAKNADRIIARCVVPTDRNGNNLQANGTDYMGRKVEPYYQKWVIKKEPKKGFIFREVTHNGGICGHHKTVRELVEAALFSSQRIIVEVSE